MVDSSLPKLLNNQEAMDFINNNPPGTQFIGPDGLTYATPNNEEVVIDSAGQTPKARPRASELREDGLQDLPQEDEVEQPLIEEEPVVSELTTIRNNKEAMEFIKNNPAGTKFKGPDGLTYQIPEIKKGMSDDLESTSVTADDLEATQVTETPKDKVISIKELEEDEDFIDTFLQYREDRYGFSKDRGAASQVTGFGFGLTEQEGTNENYVDDAMDEYRSITTNSLNAGSFLSYVSSLKSEIDDLSKKNDPVSREEARILQNKLNTARKFYDKVDSVADVTDWSKRYEAKETSEIISDVIGMTGQYITESVIDPLTIVSGGVGKVAGQVVGRSAIKQTIAGALAGATTEGIAAGALDATIQGAEVEMGIRDSIDADRVALNAGLGTLVGGTVGGAASGLASRGAKKKISKSEVQKATEEYNEKLVAQAEEKLATDETGIGERVRESLLENVARDFGEDAVVRGDDGKIKSLNKQLLRDRGAEGMKKLLDEDSTFKSDLLDLNLSDDTITRISAGAVDLLENVRNGKLKIVDDVDGSIAADISKPLDQGEMVTERLFSLIGQDYGKGGKKVITDIFAKYGATSKDITAMTFAEFSQAGKTLQRARAISDAFGRAKDIGKSKADLEEEAFQAEMAGKLYSTFRRLEDARRGLLVSGIGTAVRNNFSQVGRLGLDTMVNTFESALHEVLGTGRKRFTTIGPDGKRSFVGGINKSGSQTYYTYVARDDADLIANLVLDMHSEQSARYFANYNEVTNRLNANNGNQAKLAGKNGKVTKETPILDNIDKGVHLLNFLNRSQEFMYRNGMFTSSLDKQLANQGKDLLKVIKGGTASTDITEDMVKKATDDALEFTYASQPKLGVFRALNRTIVRSGLTTVIPFPRFMFNAMEMTYNYNVTGLMTGLTRAIVARSRGSSMADIPDGALRQISEGVAGGIPMLALAYQLTDPANELTGSDWYMLKDGAGNQFDVRPFFPLTPYILIGHMLHRGDIGASGPQFDLNIPILDMSANFKEMMEGFTGANFRGVNTATQAGMDILNALASGDETEQAALSFEIGELIGAMLTGYIQPLAQFTDLTSPYTVRRRDYNETPQYEDGVSAFIAGVGKPFEKRLTRIFGSEAEEGIEEAQDPRFSETDKRIMPFMKILFGPTLSQVPPMYVSELGYLGFSYKDFMSRSSMPELDRRVNQIMGLHMNREMPRLLEELSQRSDEFDTNEKQAFIKDFISSKKRYINKAVKAESEGNNEPFAILSQLQRIPTLARYVAKRQFKEMEGRNFDPFNLNDLRTIQMLAKRYKVR